MNIDNMHLYLYCESDHNNKQFILKLSVALANITKPTKPTKYSAVWGSMHCFLQSQCKYLTNKHQQDKDMQDMLIDRPRIEINAESSNVYPY